MIGLFGIYRMKVRQTVDNPVTIYCNASNNYSTGMELNPQTEPIAEPANTMMNSPNLSNAD